MKLGPLVLFLVVVVLATPAGARAQPKFPPRLEQPSVSDPKSGITVRTRLDNWVLDALNSENKTVWTLNFFDEGGLTARDRVSIRKLKLVDDQIHVSCEPKEVSGIVDLKTGKLLKFIDLRKK